MLEIDVPLSEFLDRALAASIRAKYLSFITIIARTADGEFLQDELLRHWESFDDLTGGEILLLSPRLTDHTYPATVKYWREPAGLVSQGLKFASVPNEAWEGKFLSVGPTRYRRASMLDPFDRFGARHSPRRPTN